MTTTGRVRCTGSIGHIQASTSSRRVFRRTGCARDNRFHVPEREPQDRILSSVDKYSRRFAETGMRFVDPAGRRIVLFLALEMLDSQGRVESTSALFALPHFRAQWIYCRAVRTTDRHHRDIRQYPPGEVDRRLSDIATRVGEPDPACAGRANPSEQIALHGRLARLASNSRVRQCGPRRRHTLFDATAIPQ